MQQSSKSDSLPQSKEDEFNPSVLIMNTLGILLILALLYGAIFGNYGLAIYVAVCILWIPSVLVVGPVYDIIKGR